MLPNEILYLTPLNDYGKVSHCCTIYIVLSVVFFITRICISSVFIYYHWYLKKDNVQEYF